MTIENKKPLPDGLLGVMFDDDRGFVCTQHLKKDEDIDGENNVTVFDTDGWFEGATCERGSHPVFPRR